MWIDFHTHTHHSDGSFSPRQLFELAHKRGIQALSLTDHDTISGLKECHQLSQELRIDFVDGIEFSAIFPNGNLHILGYGFDPSHPKFLKIVEDCQNSRNLRNKNLIQRFHELKIDINIEEMSEKLESESKILARPHFAKALIEKGIVKDLKEAFDVYLGFTGKAYFPKEQFHPNEIFVCIHEAKGKAFVAHPVTLNLDLEDLKDYLRKLKDQGLDGIEIYNSSMNLNFSKRLKQIANDLDLMQSGGSDFHGENKKSVELGFSAQKHRLNSQEISFSFFQNSFISH